MPVEVVVSSSGYESRDVGKALGESIGCSLPKLDGVESMRVDATILEMFNEWKYAVVGG